MAPTEILVSAAASLTDAFGDVGRAFAAAQRGAITAKFNFGASGALEQQIAAGAPVDVFASAGRKEMDALEKAGSLLKGTRVDFAGNRLVLIVPAHGHSTIRDWQDLADAGVRHIALSNPATVPSGRYAEETLQKRGLWKTVQPRLVYGGSVRQTLSYVANGDVDAGIVFATDARVEKRVREVAEAAAGRDHEPIVYPVAVLANAPNPEPARRFVTFLLAPDAQKLLRQRGFSAPQR